MSFEVPKNIFREYDIRGLVATELTEEVTKALGRALAAYIIKSLNITSGTVTIGRDVRNSSESLRDAIMQGLTSAGFNCIDIGECPTPLQYFSLHTMDVQGGVMITGSHNPPEYNGFKLSAGKEALHGLDIQTMRKLILNESNHVLPSLQGVGEITQIEIIPKYFDCLGEKFAHLKEGQQLKIVLDSGNGTAGPVAPELMRSLGADVIELFSEPDGNFPNHHPDPTVAENLVHLIDKVKESGADFGVAYDGDADRIGVVSETGDIVWGDQLMVIYSRAILEETPGATIVGEVKCSQTLYDDIDKNGGVPVMWQTGHSLIKSKMKELKAAMAGEMSGHIFFADRYFGFDDAIYATCRLYEILQKRRKTSPETKFSDLLAGLPKTYSTPEIRIECPDSEKFLVIRRLEGPISECVGSDEGLEIRDIITIDGLRVVVKGGWALIRASNTQPAMVMRFEAKSPELLEELKAFMKKQLLGVSDSAVVPW